MFDLYGVEYLALLVRRFHLRLMILFPFGEPRGLWRGPGSSLRFPFRLPIMKAC